MRRKFILAAVAAGISLFASPALAQNFDNRPGPGTNVSIFSPVETPFAAEALGQVITVPAGQAFITSIGFEPLPGGSGSPIFRARIYAWNGVNSITGSALYDSGPLTDPASLTTINTGAVPVTPGAQYAILVTVTEDVSTGGVVLGIYPSGGGGYDFGGGIGQSDDNASITDAWGDLTGDLGFGITFAPPAEPVPTLSEWAMILLGVLLAAVGTAWVVRRGAARVA